VVVKVGASEWFRLVESVVLLSSCGWVRRGQCGGPVASLEHSAWSAYPLAGCVSSFQILSQEMGEGGNRSRCDVDLGGLVRQKFGLAGL